MNYNTRGLDRQTLGRRIRGLLRAREQQRALVLAALMVLSVVAIGFGPGVVAADNETTEFEVTGEAVWEHPTDDIFIITATVFNPTNETLTEEVEFKAEHSPQHGPAITNESVTLGPQESKTIVTSISITVDQYPALASWDILVNDEPLENEVEDTFVLSELDIDGQGPSASIESGDKVDVSVTITRLGEEEDDAQVTLEIDGKTATERTSQLDSGESEVLTFENVAGDLGSGEYSVYVSSDDAENEVQGELVVEAPGVDSVEIETDDETTITAGEEIEFNATAYDHDGNVIEDDGSAFDWENASAGTFDETTAGDYVVTATYEDVESNEIEVTVEPKDAENADRLTLEPEEGTVTAGEEAEFTATLYDEYDNVITDESTDFDWNNATDGLFNETEAGDYEVTASNESLSNTSMVTVEPGDVAEVLIETDDDATITAGGTVDFNATAYDPYNNIIQDDNSAFDWENASAGTFDETTAGDYVVTATYEDVESNEIEVTVEADTENVDEVEIGTDDETTITAGEEIEFNATAYDEYENVIEDDDEAFEWGPEGANISDGTFTETGADTYFVTATYEGVESNEIEVTVEPKDAENADRLTLEPEEETVTAGEEAEFTATLYDEYDNVITDESTDFDWENATDGLFNETEAGDYEVTASNESAGLSNTSTVTVVPNTTAIESVEIEPDEETVATGEVKEFNATAIDTHGNEITDDNKFKWSAEEGSVDQFGMYAAPTQAGNDTVTVEMSGESANASIIVEPGNVVEVEIETDDKTMIAAGEEIEFNATAYDQNDNVITEKVDEFQWTNASAGTFDETTAGDYVVTATYEDVESNEIEVTVEPKDAENADRLTLEPEEETVTAGEEAEFTATLYDKYDNVITDDSTDFDWDNATDGLFNETEAGDYEVTASNESAGLSNTSTVTVEPGDVAEVLIETDDDATIMAGGTVDFNATAYDSYNNIIQDDNSAFDWENASAGTFDETTAGDYVVTATYEDVESNEIEVTVEANTENVDEVGIGTDDETTITAGEEIEFNATAYDEYENVIEDDDEAFEWGPEGANISDGTFIETGADTYFVTATYEGVESKEIEVTVEPKDAENADRLTLEPEEETVTAGEEAEFTATLYDKYNNVITDDSTDFDWDNATDGLFNETEAGDYEVTASNESAGLSNTSTVTVSAAYEPDRVEIEPDDDQTITAGEDIGFNATAYDEYDNVIEDDDSAFDWENATDGLFNETDVGVYNVTAELNEVPSEPTQVTVEAAEDDTTTEASSPDASPGPSDEIVAEATVSPATANGEDTVEITVRAYDDGEPVTGETITVESADGIDIGGLDESRNTGPGGETVFTATATNTGDVTITFSDESGNTDEATVSFVAGPASAADSEFIVEDHTLAADGETSTLAIVTLYDAHGNAVTDTEDITITTTAGTLSAGIESGDTVTAEHDDGNVYIATLTSGTAAEVADVTAAVPNGEIGTETVEFIAQPTNIDVAVGDADDGEVLITVTITDAQGDPMEDVIVTAETDEGLILDGASETDTNGEIAFTATADDPGEYDVTFTEETAGEETVTVTIPDADDDVEELGLLGISNVMWALILLAVILLVAMLAYRQFRMD